MSATTECDKCGRATCDRALEGWHCTPDRDFHVCPDCGPPVVTSPPREPMLRWFKHEHLPLSLSEASRPFCELAHFIVAAVPPSAERTVALRKLLESKDAAVRASLPPEGT